MDKLIWENKIDLIPPKEKEAMISWSLNSGHGNFDTWEDAYKQFKDEYQGSFLSWRDAGKYIFNIFNTGFSSKMKRSIDYEKYLIITLQESSYICFFDDKHLFFIH